MTSHTLCLERLVSGLSLRRVGRTADQGPLIRLLDSATSTNDRAFQSALDQDADGLVVFAEHQSEGRGRLGRRWFAPRGAGLLCSVLLIERGADSPKDAVALGPRLGLLAAVACHDAIAQVTGVQVRIRWPNDLLVDGRKVGGILVESRPISRQDAGTAYVVGMGINCLQHGAHFPPDLRGRATSLELVAQGPIDRNALAGELLTQLDRWYADRSAWTNDNVRRQWLDRAAPLGMPVCLRHAGKLYTGSVVDLDPTASLVVQLDDGRRCLFDAAETTVLDDIRV